MESTIINQLTNQNNESSNWNDITIIHTNINDTNWLKNITNCKFYGKITIESLDNEIFIPQLKLHVQSGLSNAIFYGNCYVSSNVLITNSIINNIKINSNSSIISCGLVMNNDSYDLLQSKEMIIDIGPENKGRSIKLYPNMNFIDCIKQLFSITNYRTDKLTNELDNDHKTLLSNIIGENCHLFHCNHIDDCSIGNNCLISYSILRSCTLYQSNESNKSIVISDGCNLTNCIVHDGCLLSNNVICKDIYMYEYSSITIKSICNHIILFSDSSISIGECHHSLIGPFVGFHHQSLLISSIWFNGRGNIAYNAMIGTNHTSRINDQECLIGEGIFFGLNIIIKFPCNFLSCSYSIISTNTTIYPQRIDYPFSLLLNNSSNLSNDYNIIKPGWNLWGNTYYIERSNIKFINKRKSINYITNRSLYRPYIVNQVYYAYNNISNYLSTNPNVNINSFIDGKSLQGLGRCKALVSDVNKALVSYKNFILKYCLHYYIDLIDKYIDNDILLIDYINQETIVISQLIDFNEYLPIESNQLYDLYNDLSISMDINNESSYSNYIKSNQLYYLNRFYSIDINNITLTQLDEFINQLLDIEKQYRINVINSRNKDNIHGNDIIPDYNIVNEYANNHVDIVIDSCNKRIELLNKTLTKLIN